MLEKTLIIVEGEDACKLFDCFLAYKKIIGAPELPEFSIPADNLTVGALEIAEEQTVELKTKRNL